MLDRIKSEIQMIYSSKAQSQNGRRILWADMARGFAIILVVMGHRGFITARTNTWISSFHLPLFFMVSGILLEIKNEKDNEIFNLLIKKIKSLIIPYFLFSFCSMALDFHFVPAGPENLIPDFKLHLLQTFTLQGYSVMWFLPVTFIAEVIVFLIYRKTKLSAVTLVTIILSFAGYYAYQFGAPFLPLILSISLKILTKSLIASAFMCFGAIFIRFINRGGIARVKNSKENCVTETNILPTESLLSEENVQFVERFNIVQLLVGIVLFALNIVAAWFIQLKDLNNLDLGYLTVYFALGITGSCGLFLICKNCINIAPLTYFGRNSLIIFCTHLNCYVLYYGTIFYMHFYKHYSLPDIVNENVTANIYTMIFTFLLSIPVIFVINVFLPFMIGKRYELGGRGSWFISR